MGSTGRVLAIDYGERNIGLAYCDEFGIAVQPLPSIPNAGRRNFFRKVRETVRAMDIRQLVLGMPWNMDGTRGEAADRIGRLMRGLEASAGIPLTAVDERLSTMEAKEIWSSLGPRRQRKYRTIDSLAAAIILERYIKERC